MTYTKKIMQRLKADPIPVILDRAPANVKYLTLKEFRYKDHELIEELKTKIEDDKNRQKILDDQDENGYWSIEEHFTIEERQKSMQFLQQLKNLTKLYYYGDTLENENVKKGLISLIKFQKIDGKFPLLLHHHGYALLLLSKFGLSRNPLVEKSFRWISKKQRADGGWLSSTMIPEGADADNLKSCVWTTMVITQAFSIHSRLKNSEVCHKGANFLLENYLSVESPNLYPEPNAWDYLLANFNDTGLFRGGTLRFLETLLPLTHTHQHKSFKKAIEWMLNIQFSDGLFPAIANISKQGDHMVSYKVMKIFKKLNTETIE